MGRAVTVLCIDDEPNGLLLRKFLLEGSGYRVLTATSGPEGIAVFENEPVDLVVLDYTMPEMDGGEVARELKRQNPQVPILFLSAHLTLPREVLKLVDGFVTKGESPAQLLEKIANAVCLQGLSRFCQA